MARIRSLKPSFWTDEKVIGLTRDARLLCIGMISHADDEGRLLATVTKLAGDIFPADELKAGQLLKWRTEIANAGLVQIYCVGAVEYASFRQWKKHQRISKPQPSSLPGPERAEAQARNRSAPKRGTVPQPDPEPVHDEDDPSRAEASTSRRQEGRQETGVPPSAGREVAPPGEPDRTGTVVQALIGEWIDNVPKRPPGNVIGQVGKQLKAMLDEGVEPQDMRSGLAEWVRKGLHPSTLPSVVNEVMNRVPAAAGAISRRQQETDAMFDRAMARARALDSMETHGEP